MRVLIAYPPLPSDKGVPLLSQNRQFQWFNRPTFIYPVIPAMAATLARDDGHAVEWLDGIAEGLSPEAFHQRVASFRPDAIAIETKTPVVKRHWEIVADLKRRRPGLRTVLLGDHVTALPEESFARSPVDYILTGGDYDFLLRNLLRHLERGESLEPGIWWREGETVRNSGPFELKHDLRGLPHIDRELTRWRLYSTQNGNFRRLPGSYIMAGRDCWHGRCTFCSWTTLYPSFRVRDPLDVADEVEELVVRCGVREIMDDTGTLPVGDWLARFCEEMIRRGLHRRVRLDGNMRFGRLSAAEFALMRRAGFRLVLFGLESANQATLDRLQKGVAVEDIVNGARAAARAGLDVHVTVMLGYPWEGPDEIARTVALARDLLRRGLAYTLQVTMVVPYPGTPLFRELDEAGLLTTRDWDEYDMRTNVMKCPVDEARIKTAVRDVYRAFLLPQTVARRLLTTRDPVADVLFYLRGFRSLLGHLRDFR